MELPTESEPVRVLTGDCRELLAHLPADCVDAVVTDPPYALTASARGSTPGSVAACDGVFKRVKSGGFMGQKWDAELPGVETWSACLRVLKPGGYMLAMGGTRTYHRLACAVEDAGFEVRDTLAWLYGSGFPKHKACLKPAYEPILLCRKPGLKVLPLSIDECRVPTDESLNGGAYADRGGRSILPGDERQGAALGMLAPGQTTGREFVQPVGRWPANVLHDGSDEVLEAFAAFGERKAGGNPAARKSPKTKHTYGEFGMDCPPGIGPSSGTAARFFYCAKSSRRERGEGNNHPTVKPLALIRWQVRLVTPPGGLVLDPFGGSGTTGRAAVEEGRRAVLCELSPEYAAIARQRIGAASRPDLFAGVE